MLSIAAVGTHLPISGCDVGRRVDGSVGGVTNGREVKKFAGPEWIVADARRCREMAFAESRIGEAGS